MSISRTISFDDVTPEELAAEFAGMDGEEQARFFSEVGKIAATWPGAGMCVQALHIAEHLDSSGRYVIERIADHADLLGGAQ